MPHSSKSSFPKVVVGNLSFLLSLFYFITTDPRQKPSGMTTMEDSPSSFPRSSGPLGSGAERSGIRRCRFFL